MSSLTSRRIRAAISSRVRNATGRPHQLLQRDVDQVRRVVLHQCRRPDRLLRDSPGPLLVVGDALPLTHQLAVQLGGVDRLVLQPGALGQLQRAAHVLHHRPGDLVRLREVAQLLVALQRQSQSEQVLIRPGPLTHPRHFLGLGGEEHMHLPRRHQPLEARIRGPFYRGHASGSRPRSRKRSLPRGPYQGSLQPLPEPHGTPYGPAARPLRSTPGTHSKQPRRDGDRSHEAGRPPRRTVHRPGQPHRGHHRHAHQVRPGRRQGLGDLRTPPGPPRPARG